MSAKYYYAVRDKWKGPVTLEKLQSLAAREELVPSDRIWTKGMAEWQPAKLTPAIFQGLPPRLDLVSTMVPPPPQACQNRLLELTDKLIPRLTDERKFVAALTHLEELSQAGACGH